ncbi:MAG TPA: LLM class flavin-dependent oxidoreductase, partial [Candidatus Dormibacteraeota bacterium]|nr:LLM class flavin-dependent oxidoreductase [Candidatus Dormibacteraeota bacterium]
MNERIGANVDVGRSLAQAVERARLAESLGCESLWMTQRPASRDTSLVLAAYGAATERVHLGTAVLPIYARHPTAMVQMAATLDELTGGRFRLGIGISHRVTVEAMWGLRLERPVEAMREYLTILRAGLREGSASCDGRQFTARWAYTAPRRADLPVLLAALNPRMLELAGELADGVLLWMCSPGFVREHVLPQVQAGRERAGLGLEGFDVVAAVPVCLTDDPAAGREVFRQTVRRYAALPFYRRMMDASGFAEELSAGEVSDAMLDELGGVGDEAAVRDIVRRYREAGCTLPVAGPFSGHAGAR